MKSIHNIHSILSTYNHWSIHAIIALPLDESNAPNSQEEMEVIAKEYVSIGDDGSLEDKEVGAKFLLLLLLLLYYYHDLGIDPFE